MLQKEDFSRRIRMRIGVACGGLQEDSGTFEREGMHKFDFSFK